MTRHAFLFPGQGAQSVGMGRAAYDSLPAARALFDRAADIVGYDLAKLCFDGPAPELDATDRSQPALFVSSLAALEGLKARTPEIVAGASAAAGLSLGEYTALVFAGVMDFESGLRLVQTRGSAMQAAADAVPSGMVSILGLEKSQVEDLCAEARSSVEGGSVDAGSIAASSVSGDPASGDPGTGNPGTGNPEQLEIANLLCPGNIAVSGTKAACARIAQLAPQRGAMKAVPLAVAGAFHTSIMQSAVARLTDALADVTMQKPRIPVVSNVDALPHDDPEEIRKLLVRQVVSPVRWEDSMRYLLAQGYRQFYEIGPGRVLKGLLRRIDRSAECENVSE